MGKPHKNKLCKKTKKINSRIVEIIRSKLILDKT